MDYDDMEFMKNVAMLAMQALIAKQPASVSEEEDDLPAEIANGAWDYAEAFMAEMYERTNAMSLVETDHLEDAALRQD